MSSRTKPLILFRLHRGPPLGLGTLSPSRVRLTSWREAPSATIRKMRPTVAIFSRSTRYPTFTSLPFGFNALTNSNP